MINMTTGVGDEVRGVETQIFHKITETCGLIPYPKEISLSQVKVRHAHNVLQSSNL